MRAVLLASATATTRLGRRRRSPITHGSALVAFERSKLALAPLIRSRRKYGLPRLILPWHQAQPGRELAPTAEAARFYHPVALGAPNPAAARRPHRGQWRSACRRCASPAARSRRTQPDARAKRSPDPYAGVPAAPGHGAAARQLAGQPS